MKTTQIIQVRGCGFTLIELLVVIAIIALLATIALPAFQGAMTQAQIAQTLSGARGIGQALHMFAMDHEGFFPHTTNQYGEQILTSNAAFRDLIPGYVDAETAFVLARSKTGPRADNKIEPYTEILRQSENHFNYISGLSTSSRSSWPLLADSTNGAGLYVSDDSLPGGCWRGLKAVVVRVDTSAKAIALKGSPTARYVPRDDDPAKNMLAVSDYMGPEAKLLEPD